MLSYLDLRTDKRESSLEELIDKLVLRARSASELPEMYIQECQHYLELICLCQGHSYHTSPGLLVGVSGDGRIAFASVEDIRDLQTTFAAIQVQQTIQAREIAKLTRDLRLRHVQPSSRTPQQRLAL